MSKIYKEKKILFNFVISCYKITASSSFVKSIQHKGRSHLIGND